MNAATKPRIVVIEDHAMLRDSLNTYLSHMGYEPVVAGNGMDGLAALRSQPPDALLLNVHLPDISGIDVLSRIRSNSVMSDIPVVLMSGFPIRFGEPRFDAFLQKPFRFDELDDLLRRLIEDDR